MKYLAAMFLVFLFIAQGCAVEAATNHPTTVYMTNAQGAVMESGEVVAVASSGDVSFIRAGNNTAILAGVLARQCNVNATCPVAIAGIVDVLLYSGGMNGTGVYYRNQTAIGDWNSTYASEWDGTWFNSTTTAGNVLVLGLADSMANGTETRSTTFPLGFNGTIGYAVETTNSTERKAKVLLQLGVN